MTNAERDKKRIQENIYIKGRGLFAVDRESGRVQSCDGKYCKDCLFNPKGYEDSCERNIIRWLMEDTPTNFEANLDNITKYIRVEAKDKELYPCNPSFGCAGCMFYDEEHGHTDCHKRAKEWLFDSAELTKDDIDFLRLLDEDGEIKRTDTDELFYVKEINQYMINYKPIPASIAEKSGLRNIKKNHSVKVATLLKGKFDEK